MSVKPSLPKGTRDLLPEEMLKREYINARIKSVFRKYGYGPIETPAMEQLSTLTGKYGEEGDKLIFKILNNGEFLKKADDDAYKAEDSASFANSITDKALRYDLTVPFARFVVQNQNELSFPFRRYQIQPVWRADRPQKGRFREFYQCDADAVGSDSLLLELEFLRIYDEVFSELRIPVEIHLNNRKLLAGFAEVMGISDRLSEFTVLLDKLDKIGWDGVVKLLKENNFPADLITSLEELLNQEATTETLLQRLEAVLADSKTGMKGLQELAFLLEHSAQSGFGNSIRFDFSLARGLDYYTGAIFEVKVLGVNLGSVGGGGRYDDLTGVFGLKGLSGVGISFGLDRIQLAMDELSAFPDLEHAGTEVLFVNFGEREALFSLNLANELRNMNVKTEVYPDSVKLKKQLDYANKRGISKVIMIGSTEIESEVFILKEMDSGKQRELRRIELLEYFSRQNQQYGSH